MDLSPEELNSWSRGRFPGLLGIEVLDVSPGSSIKGRLVLREEHLAPNGYLHAGTVIGLADTLSGYGTMASLPGRALGFTTIEMKTSFLATATSGTVFGEARLVHGGRTTQVWDAEVSSDAGKRMALFRCTQLLLYPEEYG